MNDQPDERCPLCNGTGGLPAKRIARYERERDLFVLRLHTVGRLWGEICDIYTESKRKGSTLEGLCAKVRTAYTSASKGLTLDERTGTRHDE